MPARANLSVFLFILWKRRVPSAISAFFYGNHLAAGLNSMILVYFHRRNAKTTDDLFGESVCFPFARMLGAVCQYSSSVLPYFYSGTKLGIQLFPTRIALV